MRCARRPRVAVLSTGSELRAPGEPLAPGEIYESNSVLIAAQLGVAGADADGLHRSSPTMPRRRAPRSSAALEHDVLITSGGVSVGAHDLVRATARRARCRGGLLAGRREARQADRLLRCAARRSSSACRGTPSRRSSGSSCSSARRCARCRARREPGPDFLPGTARRAACDGTRSVTSSCARARSGDQLEPLSGQDSHMIVRAAAANALVLDPPRRGRAAGGRRGRLPPDLSATRPRAVVPALCAAGRAVRARRAARAPAAVPAPGAAPAGGYGA